MKMFKLHRQQNCLKLEIRTDAVDGLSQFRVNLKRVCKITGDLYRIGLLRQGRNSNKKMMTNLNPTWKI